MDLKQRITAFNNLGEWLRNYFTKDEANTSFEDLDNILIKAKVKNQWFTPENSKLALKAWSELLTTTELNNWINTYNIEEKAPKQVGIIMAGNIPLVGFHDLLAVLMSGNIALAKTSSDDEELMPFIINKLIEIEPEFSNRIKQVEQLKNPDGVIATGSNNTARYFNAYFGKYPNIIRKNRHSVSVITGKESKDDLKALADDIFMYFGLGCRNITKLYLPKGYDLNNIFGAIHHYEEIGNHNKYGNNYDYYRAIYLLNLEPFLENGFAVMRENKNLGSPVAVINYEYYNTLDEVQSELESHKEEIQCVVSLDNVIEHNVAFGNSQKPGLADYADNVDTIDFLMNL